MAEWFYRLLLRLYPQSYLSEYRQPMEQVFRDQLRETGTPSQRMLLYLATLQDFCRSVPVAHLRNNSGPVRLYGLFLAMATVICSCTAMGVNPNWIDRLLGLCAFTMGFLDPRREGNYSRIFQSWKIRLSIVMGAAMLLWGNPSWRYTGFFVGVIIPAYLGVWLRSRVSSEFADAVNFREPLILELGLGETGDGNRVAPTA